MRSFETAARLDSDLAAPHFQLYNMYRQAGRTADAARELQVFEEIKSGTRTPRLRRIWSGATRELYDPRDPAQIRVSARAANRTGAATLDFDGDGRADLIVWSAGRSPGLQGRHAARRGKRPGGPYRCSLHSARRFR